MVIANLWPTFSSGKSFPVLHLHSYLHLKTTYNEVWWWQHRGKVAFYNSWDREAGQEDSFSNRTITLGEAGAQHRHRLSNLTNHTIDHNKPRHQQTTSKQTILLQTILTHSYRLKGQWAMNPGSRHLIWAMIYFEPMFLFLFFPK